MIFNHRYMLGDFIDSPEQEDILNCPEFYAMSSDEIYKSSKCPNFLKKILLSFPWSLRPNCVQVRPQDFRTRVPNVLGNGWHCDINTTLANGKIHSPKDLDEFRMLTVSFGDVAETEVIKKPLQINDVSPYDFVPFFNRVTSMVDSMRLETIVAGRNQILDYSSTDIHRIHPSYRIGNMRLIIVAFECDEAVDPSGGAVLPSIMEKTK